MVNEHFWNIYSRMSNCSESLLQREFTYICFHIMFFTCFNIIVFINMNTSICQSLQVKLNKPSIFYQPLQQLQLCNLFGTLLDIMYAFPTILTWWLLLKPLHFCACGLTLSWDLCIIMTLDVSFSLLAPFKYQSQPELSFIDPPFLSKSLHFSYTV